MAADHDVTQQDDTELAEAEEYWTEERLRAAEPISPPEPSPEEMERLREQQEEEPPEGTSPRLIAPAGEASGRLGGTPYAPDTGTRPYWNCGAIFFTTPDGDKSGSAAFVGSDRMLLTAAHCVRDGKTGAWYKNVIFYRAFWASAWGRGGQKVGIRCLGTRGAWVNGNRGDVAYDYSFCYTSDASGAGWLGFATRLPYPSWTSVGYPGNYGGGKQMFAVAGDKGTVSGGLVQMLGNPFTQGCSGGPWIGNLSREYGPSNNIAVGVNSFILASDPGKVWGPLFDDATADLYGYMAGNPCG